MWMSHQEYHRVVSLAHSSFSPLSMKGNFSQQTLCYDCLLFRMTNSTSDSTLLQQGLSFSELSETTWQRHFNSGKCTVIPITPNKRKPCSALDIPQPPWAESRNHKFIQLLIGVTINKYLTCPCHSSQRQQSSWLLAAKLPDLHPWGSSSYQQNHHHTCHRVCINSLGHAQPERHSSVKKNCNAGSTVILDRPQVGESGTANTLQPTHYAVHDQQQHRWRQQTAVPQAGWPKDKRSTETVTRENNTSSALQLIAQRL